MAEICKWITVGKRNEHNNEASGGAIIWCPVPTLSSCDMYMTLDHTEYFDYCNHGWSVGYTIIIYWKPHQNITWKVICGSVILHEGRHPPPIFASYCRVIYYWKVRSPNIASYPGSFSLTMHGKEPEYEATPNKPKQQLAACMKSVLCVHGLIILCTACAYKK